MNQAENAIEEDFDDYAYDSNYDLYDSLDCEDVRDMTDRPSRFVQRHILPGLHPLIEEIRANNGAAKMGEELRCPMCGRKFVKKSYQQKFCTNNCKVKYHNKRQVWY
ncbi:hypothetical protein [Muribaculum sp.]|uniref:hypothetical protein n=1 Tax=Muribaculum sp. TaxID=1918611 RepID=UPI00258FC5FF|nr:hypothetical protein [Muribaculum sp.]MCX4279337.1 hypothetical protein [Muribaculum sp.]